MSDSLEDNDAANTTTRIGPSLLPLSSSSSSSSSQKRLREEPGYTFFWFPRRKRQRQNEELDPSFPQEPYSANSESSTGMTNSVATPSSWSNLLWSRTSSATYDRAGEDASSSDATNLSLPPVSRMSATHQENDLGALPSNANLEASQESQGNRTLRTVVHAAGEWKDSRQGDLGANANRARKRTIWLLLLALGVFLVSAVAFRIFGPLTRPFYGGRFTATNSQCWEGQASQDERMSLDQPKICQSQSNKRQVTIIKMLATFTTWAANVQAMVFRACQQLVQHVIVTPSHVLYQQGKAFLHTASEVTLTMLRILCSYPFQSVSALFILLVARIYNLVVSNRFEYY